MDRKRILVLAVSLMVAMVATFVIVRGADARYATASRTVTAYEAVAFLSQGSTLTESQVKAVRIPAAMAPGLATSVAGRTLLTSVMPGNLLYADELTDAASLGPGLVSVSVPVSQAAGDGVTAGDMVDVFAVLNGQASLLAAGVEVRGSYNAQGDPVGPRMPPAGMAGLRMPGAAVPAVVELLVPSGAVQAVVQNNRNIYLVRVK